MPRPGDPATLTRAPRMGPTKAFQDFQERTCDMLVACDHVRSGTKVLNGNGIKGQHDMFRGSEAFRLQLVSR